MTRTRILLASTALVSVLALTPALAETNWTGDFNNEFNVFENWDSNFNGGDLVIDGNHAVTTSTTTIATDINSVNAPDNGPRSLVISGGATLTSTIANYAAIAIGWSAGTTSTMTVTGAGSKLVVEGTNAWTNVGWEAGATGILTVADGGTFETNYNVSVGHGAGSNGTISVDNANLNILNSGELYIADGGDGTVNITNGSTATVTGRVYIGNSSGVTGTLNITNGSNVTFDGQITTGVAQSSTGNITVSGGSSLTVNDDVLLGYLAGSSSTFTVTGSGTTSTITHGFYVGFGNIGETIVSDGARLSVTGDVTQGYAAGTDGYVTVTGAGLDSRD